METNTIILWVIVALAVSVVVSGAWAAFMAASREGSGGSPRGSLERDDDEQLRR
jgi:hypothetical protein